jgi:hypothetical protein
MQCSVSVNGSNEYAVDIELVLMVGKNSMLSHAHCIYEWWTSYHPYHFARQKNNY